MFRRQLILSLNLQKKENDTPSELFLHRYIREQLEEETSAQKIIYAHQNDWQR